MGQSPFDLLSLKYLSILKSCTFSFRRCTPGFENLKRNNARLKGGISASPKGAQFAIPVHALHNHSKHVMFHKDLIDRPERLHGPRFVNQNARQLLSLGGHIWQASGIHGRFCI